MNIVTVQTYTQFRLTKMKSLMLFNSLSAVSGKKTETNETAEIKIMLGINTPLFNDVLSIREILLFYKLLILGLGN